MGFNDGLVEAYSANALFYILNVEGINQGRFTIQVNLLPATKEEKGGTFFSIGCIDRS